MSLIKFLDEINTESFDKETKDKFLSRKDALGKMSSFGKKFAVSALPLGALATFASPTAQAQDNSGFIAVLNYALTLEFLEYRFYEMGLDCDVIPSDDTTVFAQIEKHEEAHVNFLQSVISDTLEGEPIAEPGFDFTANGTFDPFNNYAQFMALSQGFEDTGVRAYKGQAGAAQSNDTILTAALQIHSVEARHASQVRRMREQKGWITQDNYDSGFPAAAGDKIYAGEENATQVVSVESTLSGDGDVSADNITEAWDEPLTMEDVTNSNGDGIADPFIVPAN